MSPLCTDVCRNASHTFWIWLIFPKGWGITILCCSVFLLFSEDEGGQNRPTYFLLKLQSFRQVTNVSAINRFRPYFYCLIIFMDFIVNCLTTPFMQTSFKGRGTSLSVCSFGSCKCLGCVWWWLVFPSGTSCLWDILNIELSHLSDTQNSQGIEGSFSPAKFTYSHSLLSAPH